MNSAGLRPARPATRSAAPAAQTCLLTDSPLSLTPWRDSIAPLSSDDPKFLEGAAKALGIYWRDTIDVPVIQWLHRIAYNQTYWTNWPTEANPAMGTNGAFWAHTGLLVVTSLQPAAQ